MFRSSGYGFNHSWSLKHIHVMSVPGGTTDAGGPASKFAPGGGVVMNLFTIYGGNKVANLGDRWRHAVIMARGGLTPERC
ncbi:hypothetical protein QYF36_019192 [Acer negundo]|nr:hypothetical protein QYF36_019192 [Acer negundo]